MRKAESTPRHPFQTISIVTPRGLRLEANHYKLGNKKVVLIVHGFFQNKDTELFQRISDCLLPDFDVVTLDLPGHGKSQGRFTLTAQESSDLIPVLEFLQTKYDKIGLLAFSLGAAIAIVAAAESGLAGSVVAVSAPTAFEKIDFQFWRIEAFWNLMDNLSPKALGKSARLGNPFLKKPKPLDAVKKLERLPIFFIHGTQDWLIRPYHSELLHAAAATPKKLMIVPGGLHAEKLFEQFPGEFRTWVTGWFHETL